MKRFWVSWWAHSVPFTIHSPWWLSGMRERPGGDDDETQESVCAAVLATSEQDARAKVIAAHDTPVELEWRFVESKPDDWTPYSDRFGQREWMKWPATPDGRTEAAS